MVVNSLIYSHHFCESERSGLDLCFSSYLRERHLRQCGEHLLPRQKIIPSFARILSYFTGSAVDLWPKFANGILSEGASFRVTTIGGLVQRLGLRTFHRESARALRLQKN